MTFSERFKAARESFFGFAFMDEQEKLFKEADDTINQLKFQIEIQKLTEIQLNSQIEGLSLALNEDPDDPEVLSKQAKALRDVYLSSDSRCVAWEGLGNITKDRWIDLVKKAKEIIGNPAKKKLLERIEALEEQNQALLEELSEINLEGNDEEDEDGLNEDLVKIAKDFLNSYGGISPQRLDISIQLLMALAKDILKKQS